MSVKELIKQLKKFNKNAEVKISFNNGKEFDEFLIGYSFYFKTTKQSRIRDWLKKFWVLYLISLKISDSKRKCDEVCIDVQKER